MRDVARVVDGIEEPKNLAFIDERPALTLDVQKQSGANTVSVADGIRAAVAKLQAEMPHGVTLQVVRDDSTFIRESIEDVQVTMILGGLLTVFIVFLFLNSWRSTVITGLTLPISVVAAFIAMNAFGFTLNVLTLMGLSLAIGMLIDDAIVVRENIVRHLQQGKDHHTAAADGTAEIGLAVMATTFTIVAVFIPVAFMGGMVGQFFYEFGITVAAAVLVSLFVSFTLDPMLSSRWHDPDAEHEHDTTRRRGIIGRSLQRFNHWFDRLHGSYERVLAWSLRHRLSVIGMALVAFFASFPILGMLGGDFMPDYNRGEYQITFKGAPGSTLRETGERAQEVVRRLKAIPDVVLHLHDDRRDRHDVPAGHRRHHLRQAEGPHRQVVQRGAARSAHGDRAGAGLHLRIDGSGSLRTEADPDQRARAGDRRDGSAVTRADGEDGADAAAWPTSRPASRSRSRSCASTSTARAPATSACRCRRFRRRCARRSRARSRRRSRTRGDTHDVRVRLQADQRRYTDDLLTLTVPSDNDDAERRQDADSPAGARHRRGRRPARRPSAARICSARCACRRIRMGARSARS